MSELDVRTMLGEPGKINDNGGHIQWVYYWTWDGAGNPKPGSTYVYFRNGVTY
jgi:hypothetical protein